MKRETVLIVDDESGVRDVLRDILENEGYTVVAVGSAMATLEEVRQRNFDVAVVDIKMPDMNGLMLIQKVRELDPRIAPVLITGYPSPETEAIANQYGIHDYLAKPIYRVEFCETVANALKRRKLAEGVAENKRGRAGKVIHSKLIPILRNCELFEALSHQELQSISGLCEERSYKAGEIIYDQDKRSEKLYVIQEGSVALVRSAKVGGMEQFFTIDFLGKGRVLGWTALLEPHVHTASAVCRSPTKVLALNGTELRFILSSGPAGVEVMQRLAMLLGNRLRASYCALDSKVQKSPIDSGDSSNLSP